MANDEDNGIDFVSELIRFAIVGVINTAVDLAVLNALIAMSHTGRSGLMYSLFKAISFLVAVLNSYFMNSKWTFRQTVPQTMQLSRFFLVSVTALVINVGTASCVASLIQPLRGFERYWPSIAAMAGAIWGVTFNFAGYKYLVFSPRLKPAGLNSGRPDSMTRCGRQDRRFRA